MSGLLASVPIGLIANKVAESAGVTGGIPGLRDGLTVAQAVTNLAEMKMMYDTSMPYMKHYASKVGKAVKNRRKARKKNKPKAGQGAQAGDSQESDSPTDENQASGPAGNKNKEDSYNPDQNFESDHLKNQKEERAQAAGLRSAKRNAASGNEAKTDGAEDQGGGSEKGTVAQDQAEGSRARSLNLAKRRARVKKNRADKLAKRKAARLKKAAAKKGSGRLMAAVLGGGLGALYIYWEALKRLIKAELLQDEEEKFDNPFERIGHIILVIGVPAFFFMLMVMVVIMIMEQFGFIIKIIGWFS